MKHYYRRSGVTLYQGDSLSVLRDLPSESADALVTDPPYSSGGLHRSDRNQSTTAKYVQTGTKLSRPDFQGDNRDQRSYLVWCRLWLAECLRILKPGRPALVFTDWRQLPVTTDALQVAGFVWRGVVPWDKGRGVRPTRGFSAQAEYVVWGTRGPVDLGHDVYLDGVQHAAVKRADKHHITGKPTALMGSLLKVVPSGGLVLDPFAGSGTTLVAARDLGLRAVGIEADAHYCEVTAERLRGEAKVAA